MPLPIDGALSVDDRCLSVCLYVPWLALSRERKGVARSKSTRGKPVTPFRDQRSRSRSPGRNTHQRRQHCTASFLYPWQRVFRSWWKGFSR